jgi:HEAT repeat protein
MQSAIRSKLHTTIAAALLLAGASSAYAASNDEMAPADKQLNQLYWQGHEALKHSDWNQALKRFTDLEKQMRTKEPKNADAVIYWEAYTLLQAKRATEAKAAVERLHHDFPDSRWIKDADALVRQGQNASLTVQPDASAGDDDIAEIAVEGLLNAPPERALPLLKKVLQSQHSDKVKKRALFVLSQIGDDAALGSVVDVAKNSKDRELREEAIRMLGVSGQDRAIERLGELYASASNAQEKRTIIQAWLTADRKDLILASARNEADAGVRNEAIQALGALEASTELKQLFDSTHDAQTQREIIQALGVAGNVQVLASIAAAGQAEDVRAQALQALGVAGSEGGAAQLVKLYPQMTTPALRDAVMQGLLVAGDGNALMQLYRQAKSKEEKQALLRTLTALGDDSALNVIEHELDKHGESHD